MQRHFANSTMYSIYRSTWSIYVSSAHRSRFYFGFDKSNHGQGISWHCCMSYLKNRNIVFVRLPKSLFPTRYRAKLGVSRLHLVQGRIPPLYPPCPPQCTRPRRDNRGQLQLHPAPPHPSTHVLPMAKTSDFQDLRQKRRTASI